MPPAMGAAGQFDDAITAARELSHAACHLADIASRATNSAQLPEQARAGRLALEASVRAAQASFTLDDAARSEIESAAILWLAVDAIAIAEETIALAREALETMLPAPLLR